MEYLNTNEWFLDNIDDFRQYDDKKFTDRRVATQKIIKMQIKITLTLIIVILMEMAKSSLVFWLYQIRWLKGEPVNQSAQFSTSVLTKVVVFQVIC